MFHLPLFLSFSFYSFIFFIQSISATTSLIYGGCSQLHFTPGTPYELNINSLFTSLVNSASTSNFNNFTISPSGYSQPNNVVFGLFQCEGDLRNSDCRDCVANSVSQLKTICPQATGGVIQLEGCFVKYDNTSFFGYEDVTEVSKRCGPSIGYDSDALNHRDAALAYLTASNGQYFRGGGSGSVQGVAQCVQDLSVSECQDCLTEASGRLRSECETAAWGDMFLGKCYIRYVDRQHHSRTGDEDVDKTLALTIGVITGVILLRLCVVGRGSPRGEPEFAGPHRPPGRIGPSGGSPNPWARAERDERGGPLPLSSNQHFSFCFFF